MKNYIFIKNLLKKVYTKIEEGKVYTGDTYLFMNKSVKVCFDENDKKESDYPDLQYVITKHCFELSWLFFELNHSFYSVFNSLIEREFYRRLAVTVNYVLKQNPDIDSKLLLLSALYEATVILEEMNNNTLFVSAYLQLKMMAKETRVKKVLKKSPKILKNISHNKKLTPNL